MKKWSPRALFATAGCLFLLSLITGVIGLVILLGSYGARRNAVRQNALSPRDGTYDCTMRVGAEETVIRKFSIAGTSYSDLSFNQGGGSFTYDRNDRTMAFADGPFAKHFIGVFVPRGARPMATSKVRFQDSAGDSADADTIRLLDLNTDYSRQTEPGVPCKLVP